MTGGLEKMFCAGANIRMLAQSSHAWKVNFCKFTNETRNAIEDARETSGQTWIAALNGTAAGGGYELALACDEIVLIDDGSSTVSLPEVPAARRAARHRRPDPRRRQAARPQGPRRPVRHQVRGLPRRHRRRLGARRRDRRPQGLGRGDRAPGPRGRRRAPSAVSGDRASTLTPLDRTEDGDTISYPYVTATLDRDARRVDITVAGPTDDPPADAAAVLAQGADW